jgi:hypothetical protein
MSILNKTRKLLWGRSGNRCAICKRELIIDSNGKDDDSVVGEECHIISSQPNGPRNDPSFPKSKIDSYENLILLCRVHHKRIDDQVNTFTTKVLQKIKHDHEIWVSEKLSDENKPLVIKRFSDNIPDVLKRLTSGKELLDIIQGAMAYSFDHDELYSKEEVELITPFVDIVQEWGDFSEEMSSGKRIEVGYILTNQIKELEKNGFWVFGAREIQILEGGNSSKKDNWPVAIINIVRNDNDSIKPININD